MRPNRNPSKSDDSKKSKDDSQQQPKPKATVKKDKNSQNIGQENPSKVPTKDKEKEEEALHKKEKPDKKNENKTQSNTKEKKNEPTRKPSKTDSTTSNAKNVNKNKSQAGKNEKNDQNKKVTKEKNDLFDEPKNEKRKEKNVTTEKSEKKSNDNQKKSSDNKKEKQENTNEVNERKNNEKHEKRTKNDNTKTEDDERSKNERNKSSKKEKRKKDDSKQMNKTVSKDDQNEENSKIIKKEKRNENENAKDKNKHNERSKEEKNSTKNEKEKMNDENSSSKNQKQKVKDKTNNDKSTDKKEKEKVKDKNDGKNIDKKEKDKNNEKSTNKNEKEKVKDKTNNEKDTNKNAKEKVKNKNDDGKNTAKNQNEKAKTKTGDDENEKGKDKTNNEKDTNKNEKEKVKSDGKNTDKNKNEKAKTKTGNHENEKVKDKTNDDKSTNKNEKEKVKNDDEKRAKEKGNKKETKKKELTKEELIIIERKKQIKEIGDIDLQQYQALQTLFAENPTKAIHESEKYFKSPGFSTYDIFIEEVKKTQKSNCCIYSWRKLTLIAGCFDCRLNQNSCICIPCFLAGKHDQHHSYLINSDSGNCDCGDPKLWKISGNCPNHPGPDSHPDITQMTPENRKKFITVFQSALYGAFTSHNNKISIKIFKWIQQFIEYGDGIRRCCSIAITNFGSKFFFSELMNLDNESVPIFIDLLGKLVSDQLFSLKMGSMTILNYLKLRKKIQNILYQDFYDKKSKPFHPIKKFLGFSFHFMQEAPLLFLIKEKKFNWVDFTIESIRLILETVEKTDGDYTRDRDGKITSQIWYMRLLLEKILQIDEEHDNIQIFIDKYSRLLSKFEAKYNYYFNLQEDDYSNVSGITYYSLIWGLYELNSIFCSDFESSKMNKKFSVYKVFSNLVDFLKSDQNLKVENIYESLDNIAISPLLPLHHLFYYILSSHQNASNIILKCCAKKGIEIQDFCCLASIYPLRLLASLYAPERFQNISNYSFVIIQNYLGEPEKSFNSFFGLFQTLLGISPDKEIMLKNVALTFGLFSNPSLSLDQIDDSSSIDEFLYLLKQQEEIRNTAHFDVAVFIMSVLTDRSIITFDKILFKRLRVIELMMIGKPTSTEIETYVNDKISNPLFGDDLSSYAERVTTKNGSYFKLKNEDDFTPFFPLIFHIRRMKILSKYQDKLVPFLNYTKLPHGLDFQSCFRSQTFIALMFRCLLAENRLMETQVGLSMFILSMKNGIQFNEESFKIINPLKIECETTNDVINELTKLFKDNPKINFTTIQIKFDKSSKYESIIEIVKSKQQLGYESIEKSNLPIKLKINENNDDEIQKKKKNKAKNLKEQIMKEFQNKQKIFTAGDPINHSNKIKESDDDESTDDDNYINSISDKKLINDQLQCCICQNSESNDVIGFPCISINSIFPSLINNKLHNLNLPLEKVFSLSICTHPVHFSCCSNLIKAENHIEEEEDSLEMDDHQKFHCMIDRGERNCLLPIFPTEKENIFSIKPSENLQKAINEFMIKAFKTDENIENMLTPLKSFIGIVSILEVRHRSRPDCLDNLSIPHLLRNLLLTLYFKYHNTEVKTKAKDPLLMLALKIIMSKNPISEFRNFVKDISKSLVNSIDYLYEFLRRSAIIEDFSFKIQENKEFIDWDEILSFESLLSRFDISINEKLNKSIELPLFEPIPLAEKFINLYQAPFNIDIFDASFIKFIDLLTGQVVVYNNREKMNDQTSKLPDFEDYIKNVYNDGLCIFLCLTGGNASDVIISCNELDRFSITRGFYVDQFGDVDRGFTRGSILSISHDRLENTIDKLLSGEIILY